MPLNFARPRLSIISNFGAIRTMILIDEFDFFSFFFWFFHRWCCVGLWLISIDWQMMIGDARSRSLSLWDSGGHWQRKFRPSHSCLRPQNGSTSSHQNHTVIPSFLTLLISSNLTYLSNRAWIFWTFIHWTMPEYGCFPNIWIVLRRSEFFF